MAVKEVGVGLLWIENPLVFLSRQLGGNFKVKLWKKLQAFQPRLDMRI